MRHRINLVFEELSLERFAIRSNIRRCIRQTLDAEGIRVPCEINVLVTNNSGIQTINRESRNIDAPTDVLSFPMFQLEAGNPPQDWTEYQDPATGLVPLGDMCISLERAHDAPTDVLSFPMFQLEAGNPPQDWTEYQDPATGLVPLGDMCISLERAQAQRMC